MKLCIWWLNEAECEYVMERKELLPDSIRSQVSCRYGRNGRGRLWVIAEIKGKVRIDWPCGSPLADWLEECGGIVIHQSDLEHVRQLPGVFTDMKGSRIL